MVFVELLFMLNHKFNSELYTTHVFHEHHLFPLFATAIAFLHMTLAVHD
jgi:hypothetical protein